MYIIIHENGDLVKVKGLSECDLDAAEDGYCDIIDISIVNSPKCFRSGVWIDIDTIEE